eukprot:2219901-Amphidinium_carterae.1
MPCRHNARAKPRHSEQHTHPQDSTAPLLPQTHPQQHPFTPGRHDGNAGPWDLRVENRRWPAQSSHNATHNQTSPRPRTAQHPHSSTLTSPRHSSHT